MQTCSMCRNSKILTDSGCCASCIVEGSQRSSKEGQYQQEHREQPDEEPEEELQHQPTTCAICNTNPVSASAQKLSAFCSKTAKAGGGIPKPVNVFPGPGTIFRIFRGRSRNRGCFLKPGEMTLSRFLSQFLSVCCLFTRKR